MYSHLRTAVVAGIAALSLALAPGRPLAADALSERQLREALLDAVDLPAGWASDSEQSAAKRGFGVPRPDEPDCGELFDTTTDPAARAGFARTRSGPFLTTVAAAHQNEDRARRSLAAAREAVDGACATFHAEEGPEGGDVRVAYEAERLDADSLGEESLAVRFHRRLDGESATTPVVADVVIARVGAQTVRVAQAGRDGADSGDLAAFAERAVEKLEEVASGRSADPLPDQPGTTEL
ncbi:hypothetical protein [Streptomyces sp. SBT349]|uniref:hypothetical protein n=1 Tax=Streptomyces sp. SBT349 TaxID=1580539 RepID=UPI00131DB1D9|nr:hypothetical protein [Streptomyces sp. SBT349]